MLDRVIHTTDNLDEKVGRIFSSMSFLTVGTTILFTAFLTNKLLFPIGGIDLMPLLFLGFMISVAFATAFMLQAMGPRFHIHPRRSKTGANRSVNPSPTGYADKIATMKENEWQDYFKNTPLNDLYEKMYEESIKEVYVLSKKVDRKVDEMRRAQRSFLLAIIFLVAMILLSVYSLL
jgi:hypothetical protein